MTPQVVKDKLELDNSPLLNEHNHRSYQQLIGIGIWLGQIGRIDITHAVSSLSRFSAAPREGHLSRIEKVYGYLKNWKSAHIKIDSRPHLPIGKQMFKDADWTQEYENAREELDDQFPEPRIPEIDTHI